jgi:hypothetical protein
MSTPNEFAFWKAQQEANRAARLRQLYSPAELWRRQQRALDQLAKLRPDLPRSPARTELSSKKRP